MAGNIKFFPKAIVYGMTASGISTYTPCSLNFNPQHLTGFLRKKKKVEKTQTLVKGFAQGELHRRLKMFLLEVGFKPSQKVTKDQFSS